MHNIFICFLSELHTSRDAVPTLSHSAYIRANGEACDTVQTNESALRALSDLLEAEQERIDCLFYFASKRVRQTTITFTDSLTGEAVQLQQETHEACFRRRMKKCYPEAGCQAISYDEEKNTNDSIRQVTDMTNQVMDYVKQRQWSPAAVRIHADMTGGPRHASMMMLSVMQLLKYRGIQSGRVLYANWQPGKPIRVENVTDVYRMFNLVSGADEFVRFGSIGEIEDYFARQPQSPALAALLRTMRDFSDAIAICRTSSIEESVRKLYTAIQQFEQEENKTLQETLFLQVLDIFAHEYGDLLTDKPKRLDIIAWCVRRGLLQQAITLCTEWLPEIIIDEGICYPGNETVYTDCEAQRINWQTWQQHFLINFSTSKGTQHQQTLRNQIADAVKLYEQTGNSTQAAAICPAAAWQLENFFQAYRKSKKFLQKKQYAYQEIPVWQRNNSLIHKAIHIVWERAIYRQINNMRSYTDILCQTDGSKLLRLMENFSWDDYCRLLDLSPALQEPEKKINPKDKWAIRQTEYECMLADGTMQTGFSDSEALQVLKDYYDIRTGRNAINHANKEERSQREEISELIRKTIMHIETLVTRKDTE